MQIINNYIYCANQNLNTISRISLTEPPIVNNNWATNLNSPYGLAIDTVNGYIYCSCVNGSISRIKLTDKPVVENNWAIVDSNSDPCSLAINNGYIYCTNQSSKKISKISLTNPTGDNNLNWVILGETDLSCFSKINNEYMYCS